MIVAITKSFDIYFIEKKMFDIQYERKPFDEAFARTRRLYQLFYRYHRAKRSTILINSYIYSPNFYLHYIYECHYQGIQRKRWQVNIHKSPANISDLHQPRTYGLVTLKSYETKFVNCGQQNMTVFFFRIFLLSWCGWYLLAFMMKPGFKLIRPDQEPPIITVYTNFFFPLFIWFFFFR